MQYFVDLSVKHKVSPVPDVTASNSTYSMFSSQQAAMLLDTRYATGIYRKTIDESTTSSFRWDVAPIPKHKDGILAGHSGSEAYCIAQNSRKKDLAWKFIEFMAGEEGSVAFAEAGFTLPANKELANSETFIQSGKNPKNYQVFIDAPSYQTVGDWGYLPDKDWINIWANPLNTDVLNGVKTLAELEAMTKGETQSAVDAYFHKIS
jgi:multiple sugar transport system substrate-binding protein